MSFMNLKDSFACGTQVVKLMGTRDAAAHTDFSGIVDEDVEQHLKETAIVSMGTEISQEDLVGVALLYNVQERIINWRRKWDNESGVLFRCSSFSSTICSLLAMVVLRPVSYLLPGHESSTPPLAQNIHTLPLAHSTLSCSLSRPTGPHP
jgi:hypothetical protein